MSFVSTVKQNFADQVRNVEGDVRQLEDTAKNRVQISKIAFNRFRTEALMQILLSFP